MVLRGIGINCPASTVLLLSVTVLNVVLPGNLFRTAKQLLNRNRDVVGANCVKGSDGKIVMDEDRLMEVGERIMMCYQTMSSP